jgi:hypothetical protein
LLVASVVLTVVILRPFQNHPLMDDWVYAWSVENLLATGQFEVLDYSANLVHVQALWGALFCLPFGFSFTALRVSTCVLAIATLLGLYRLLVEAGANRRNAAIGTTVLGVYPPFVLLSFSFMTEVPFLAGEVWTLVFFARALRERSIRALWLGSICAALTLGVRLAGLVPPIAMLLVMLNQPWGRARGRFWVAAMPIAWAAMLALYSQSQVRHVADLLGIPNSPPFRLIGLRDWGVWLLPRMLAFTAEFVIVVLGIVLLPLAVAWSRPRLSRRHLLLAVSCALIVFITTQLSHETHYKALTAEGSWAFDQLGAVLTVMPGWTRSPLSPAVTFLLTAVAWLTTGFLYSSSQAVPSSDAAAPLFWMTLAGFSLMAALLWLTSDRYILPFVPAAMAILLGRQISLSWGRAAVAFACYAAVAIGALADRGATERAVWMAVDRLRGREIPAADIDAGYTVNGWLQYAHPEQAHRDQKGQVAVPWMNADAELPWIVGRPPLKDAVVVEEIPYPRVLRAPAAISILKRVSR